MNEGTQKHTEQTFPSLVKRMNYWRGKHNEPSNFFTLSFIPHEHVMIFASMWYMNTNWDVFGIWKWILCANIWFHHFVIFPSAAAAKNTLCLPFISTISAAATLKGCSIFGISLCIHVSSLSLKYFHTFSHFCCVKQHEAKYLVRDSPPHYAVCLNDVQMLWWWKLKWAKCENFASDGASLFHFYYQTLLAWHIQNKHRWTLWSRNKNNKSHKISMTKKSFFFTIATVFIAIDVVSHERKKKKYFSVFLLL